MPLFLIKQPRCLFAHVPKTGGHSIRNVVFEGNYDGPWFGEQLPAEWQGLFGFGFVRNPFDRLVSAWKMFCEGTADDAWHLPEGGALTLTLQQVLRLALDETAAFGHPRYNQVRPDPLIRLKNHVIPQTHPYHGLQHVEFIGRFESLQTDFDSVIRRLGLPPTRLPRTNWTRHGPYQQYFDHTTRALAEQLYREDLDAFGYDFI
jgi:hypothetical protein